MSTSIRTSQLPPRVQTILEIARREVGPERDAQLLFVAHWLAGAIANVSAGHIRAVPVTGEAGPSEEEIRKRAIGAVLLTVEEIEEQGAPSGKGERG